MYFSQISLMDWKSFASATFRFPKPSLENNIILIGAPNGFGKTSLFEAIILGLYGQEGLPHIARSTHSPENGTKLTANSYKTFMEKAIHRGAIASGRNSCSVKLVFEFEENSEEQIEIRRIWHFNESGKFRPQDEHVEIFIGENRKPIGPKGIDTSARHDWYRKYIANNILPDDLAKFFMFDGEQVSVLAEREMSGQVQHGIEGLLGIPLLKRLATNLRKYAAKRAKSSNNVSTDKIEKLELELEILEKELDEKESKHSEIEMKLAESIAKRDILVKEIASFGAAVTQESLQEKYERINELENLIQQNSSKLEQLLAKDIALSLTGINLKEDVIKRMKSENLTENWENAKGQGNTNLDKFVGIFLTQLDEVRPKLTDVQLEEISSKIRQSWQKIWHPAPKGYAEIIVHKHLNMVDRTNVIDILNQIDSLGKSDIIDLLNKIEANEASRNRLQDEVNRTETVSPQMEKKINENNKLNEQIQAYSKNSGEFSREILGLTGQINHKKSELSQMVKQLEQSKPSIRRASRAIDVATLIDNIVNEAVPSQIKAIANEMTKAFISISHKKDQVKEIDITPDCEVKLLDSKKSDIRQFDLSAGEKQIFTQSLLSAVSSVSHRKFPMVVDTPLGRLDVEHRKGLLRHLTKRKEQIILLSTNTEVVNEYLQEIDSHVQKKYRLQFHQVGEIGHTDIQKGYFEEMERN